MENKKQTQLLGNVFQQLKLLESQPRQIEGVGEVTPSEFHLIEVIGEKGAVTGKELSQLMGVTKGAISQLLPKLEKKKLIYRRPDEKDLRVHYLSLTKQGEVAYREHSKVIEEFQELLEKELTSNQIENFNEGLSLLGQYLGKVVLRQGE